MVGHRACLLLCLLQRLANAQSARAVSQIRKPWPKHSRSLAGKLVWNFPDSLSPTALAAVCAVWHYARPDRARDRNPESADRLCPDAGDQLDRDQRFAQNSRRGARALEAMF